MAISWLEVRIRRFQILLTDSWLTSSRYFLPSAEDFRDGPGLGDAAARSEWRVAIKDFTERAEATRIDLTFQGREEPQRSRAVAVNAIVRKSEGAEQPAPYGALMIRGVAIARAATVVPGVARLTRSEAPQSVRGEEIPGANLDNRLLLFERERADGQGDSKNLVRPEGGVISDSG